MKTEQIFPLILIILQVLAGIVYLFCGNLRMFIYWVAAAVLNIVVTF